MERNVNYVTRVKKEFLIQCFIYYCTNYTVDTDKKTHGVVSIESKEIDFNVTWDYTKLITLIKKH